ncbi:NAD-dependent epimerase/dehydratase family protein [Spongiactinospora sp. 9N601]|uniref:NAD-dependent epimerase/dehydratase family protein n=1 Tax=Spongiactinospora sp. 9N601 TaxID=3375149 RepID=UPI0037B668CA
MTTVLLFGATGFLGREVRSRLAADTRRLRVVCPGRNTLDLLRASPGEAAGLLCEVRPAAVINCVGRMGGGYDVLLRGNAGVSALLIEAMTAAESSARYVRLGSAAEYGPGVPGTSTGEDAPARPVSAYGVGHLAGTLLVGQAAQEGRVDGVTLRIFNPIGPGTSAENVLGRARELIGQALAARSPHIELGPLGAFRDFVDVRDVADAVVRAAFVPELPELPGRVLNVGSGRSVVVREPVRLLAEAMGYDGELRERGTTSARSPAVDWSRADITRTGRVLGWRPRHSLAESVKAMA